MISRRLGKHGRHGRARSVPKRHRGRYKRKFEKTLSELPEGSSAEIQYVLGGHGVVLRLSEFGLCPGTMIKVVRNIKGGPKIIDVFGGRISLGHGLAMKVFVQPLANE